MYIEDVAALCSLIKELIFKQYSIEEAKHWQDETLPPNISLGGMG